MSAPSHSMRPPVGASIRHTHLIVVDFPMPLRPMRATTSPSATSSEAPNSACEAP